MQETTTTATRTRAPKIEAVEFRVTDTESPDRSVLARVATSWADFAGIIGRLKAGAPSGGAYHKTYFTITFADGATYSGRYDVQSITRRQPTISRHVADHVGYASGLVKPAHLTDEDYAGHLAAMGEPAQAYMYFFARDYAVGVETPEDKMLDDTTPMPDPEPAAMLTNDTADLDQRVEVWQAPSVQPVPYQGETGTIRRLDRRDADTSTRLYAGVELDGYGAELLYIPVGHLIAERPAPGEAADEPALAWDDPGYLARVGEGDTLDPSRSTSLAPDEPTLDLDGDAGPDEAAAYEVWIIDPNGDGTPEHETDSRTEAHNVRRELVETAAPAGCTVEVWRDGRPDPDPSAGRDLAERARRMHEAATPYEETTAGRINALCDEPNTRQRQTFASLLRTTDLHGELLSVHESERTGAITLEHATPDGVGVIEIR